MIASYTERMAAIAAGVVGDAATGYIHPACPARLVMANAPIEDMLLATLSRAFEVGVRYRPGTETA